MREREKGRKGKGERKSNTSRGKFEWWWRDSFSAETAIGTQKKMWDQLLLFYRVTTQVLTLILCNIKSILHW